MLSSDTSPAKVRSGYTLYPLPDLDVTSVIIVFLILLFSLTIHEAAHAWSASRLGDDTAKHLGRVSEISTVFQNDWMMLGLSSSCW